MYDILLYMLGGLFLFIILVYLLSILSNTITSNLKELEKEEQEITNKINHLTTQLAEQRQQYESNKLNKETNLSNVVTNVLDIYDESNIRVPADIIEELSYNTFYSELEVFEYIENQRNYWKLENTKKPLKKVKK